MYRGKHKLNIRHDDTKTTLNSQSNTKKESLLGEK